MDMEPLTKEPKVEVPIKNGEPRYAMVVIDIFSKLANVVPMKEKNGTKCFVSLKRKFQENGFSDVNYSDNDRSLQAGVKDFFEKEGITHVVTLTHTNVVEGFIRTMKNMIHDRVRFDRGSWTAMLSKALDKYNDTVHSSTKMKPKDAHDDKNHLDVRVNLTRREKNTRKYPEVKVNDMVKVFEKKKDNYTERMEYNSKWSNQSYKIIKIEDDDVGNRTGGSEKKSLYEARDFESIRNYL